jgi:hypothetical protein
LRTITNPLPRKRTRSTSGVASAVPDAFEYPAGQQSDGLRLVQLHAARPPIAGNDAGDIQQELVLLGRG